VDWSTKNRIKGPLNSRLKAEGYWNEYNQLRAHLIREGVPPELAWRVAAFPFQPKDGSPAEIVADPMYAEIEAKWKNGSYPTPPEFETFPNGATNFTKSKKPTRKAVEAAAEVKNAPSKWKAKWRALAAQVGQRSASELEEIRWVASNYLTDVSEIEPDDVPSRGALGMLSWVQESSANYGDFLRSNYTKIIPDRKTIEYEQRFNDDGRVLDLLDEFQRTFENEWQEEHDSAKGSIAGQLSGDPTA
jgi:hypothetical protein